MKKYLLSMVCKKCKGRGCERCNHKGTTKKFEKLLKQATHGLRC
jgi:hypothetical protein